MGSATHCAQYGFQCKLSIALCVFKQGKDCRIITLHLVRIKPLYYHIKAGLASIKASVS